jgi:hypothetical protein
MAAKRLPPLLTPVLAVSATQAPPERRTPLPGFHFTFDPLGGLALVANSDVAPSIPPVIVETRVALMAAEPDRKLRSLGTPSAIT